MASKSTTEAEIFLQPVFAAAKSEYYRRQLFEAIGWNLSLFDSTIVSSMDSIANALASSWSSFANELDPPPDSLNDFKSVVDEVFVLFSKREAFATLSFPSVASLSSNAVAEVFSKDLGGFLVTRYFAVAHPAVFSALQLLTLIEKGHRSLLASANETNPVRYASWPYRLYPVRILDLFDKPKTTITNAYFGNRTPEETKDGLKRLVSNLANLLRSLGIEAYQRFDDIPTPSVTQPNGVERSLLEVTGNPDNLSEVVSLKFFVPAPQGYTNFGIELLFYVDSNSEISAVIGGFGDGALEQELYGWRISGNAGVHAGLLAVTVTGAEFANPAISNFVGELKLQKLPRENGEPSILFGGKNGTRLEIHEFFIASEISFANAGVIVGLLAKAQQARFVLSPGDGDGFVSRVLPFNIDAFFDFGLGWRNDRGLYFHGSGGLKAKIPLNVSLGDTLKLDSITIGTQFQSGDETLPLLVALTPIVTLGPVTATVEEIGLQAEFAFPDDSSGNLGPVDFAFGFKPPAGAGLAIDAGAVSGGGYLFFDTAAQEYGGAVELSFMSFCLAAVGLITTQMPDGSSGFSMMVIISAEFQGVQLGFGFTLTGVGGLLGINRQADVQALRSNMKNGGLSSIMFPDNVVENAQRIVSDVGAAFPVAEGNHVFGPILRIGWGTPTLFELTMGVVLSFPSPFKVVLIGRFQLGMPSLEYDGDVPPPIWVNIDFLGVIDPSAGLLSLDGVLYDSRLAAFSLEGQFAMQQTFGDDPLFLVSIGGFHPNFEPPPQVPDLKRLSLTLGDSDNPRIRTELYTAITSNTAQVGARVDVFAKAAGFKVLGAAGFDALVVFSPFSLDVTFFIRAAVKRGSSTLFSINVNLNLTGPNPWRAKGEASFEVLFFTVKVRFSLTFGSSEAPQLPETDVLEKLKSALAETRNWSVKLPERTREPAVTFRELPAVISDSLLHPEASLTVRQQVVPFGLDIERYSGAIPTAEGKRVRRFDLESLNLNGTLYSAEQPDQITKEKEKFAPGAYLELSDEEKLSRPSFESFTAGATLAGSKGYAIPDTANLKTVVTNYEQSVVDTSTGFAFDFQPLDENGNVIPVEDIKASDAVIFSTVADDSGVKSSVYQPKKLAIRVDDPAYTVVSRGDADRMTNIAANTNFYEANKALKDSGQSKQDYHIVLVHEEKAA